MKLRWLSARASVKRKYTFNTLMVILVHEPTTSSNAAPIIWRPTGRPLEPLSTNPQGITNAGRPAKLTLTCIKNQ